jgi:hypothetical protein
MSKNKRADITVTLKVYNELGTSRTLIIEPWLTEYSLPSGKSLDVILTGDPRFPLEVHVSEEDITVFGFDSSGATMSVRDGENEAEHLPPR